MAKKKRGTIAIIAMIIASLLVFFDQWYLPINLFVNFVTSLWDVPEAIYLTAILSLVYAIGLILANQLGVDVD